MEESCARCGGCDGCPAPPLLDWARRSLRLHDLRFASQQDEASFKRASEARLLAAGPATAVCALLGAAHGLQAVLFRATGDPPGPFAWDREDPRTGLLAAEVSSAGLWLILVVASWSGLCRRSCDLELLWVVGTVAAVLLVLAGGAPRAQFPLPLESGGELAWEGWAALLLRIQVLTAGACLYLEVRCCRLWLLPAAVLASCAAAVATAVAGGRSSEGAWWPLLWAALLSLIAYHAAWRREWARRRLWHVERRAWGDQAWVQVGPATSSVASIASHMVYPAPEAVPCAMPVPRSSQPEDTLSFSISDLESQDAAVVQDAGVQTLAWTQLVAAEWPRAHCSTQTELPPGRREEGVATPAAWMIASSSSGRPPRPLSSEPPSSGPRSPESNSSRSSSPSSRTTVPRTPGPLDGTWLLRRNPSDVLDVPRWLEKITIRGTQGVDALGEPFALTQKDGRVLLAGGTLALRDGVLKRIGRSGRALDFVRVSEDVLVLAEAALAGDDEARARKAAKRRFDGFWEFVGGEAGQDPVNEWLRSFSIRGDLVRDGTGRCFDLEREGTLTFMRRGALSMHGDLLVRNGRSGVVRTFCRVA